MLVPSRTAKAIPAKAAALGVVSACRVDGPVRSGRVPSVTPSTVATRPAGRLIRGEGFERAGHFGDAAALAGGAEGLSRLGDGGPGPTGPRPSGRRAFSMHASADESRS
jgi:hypothetical protein